MEIVAYTEDGILNLILNQKKRAAQKCGIDFQIEASVPQKGMVEIYDLNMLIMNLCDNAIEAAAKVEDGFVKIKIAKRKAYLHIEIENSTEFNVMAETEFDDEQDTKRNTWTGNSYYQKYCRKI